MTVNHGVVGSSPTGGAISRVSKDTLLFFLLLLVLFCRTRLCEQEEMAVGKMRSRLSKLLSRCVFKEIYPLEGILRCLICSLVEFAEKVSNLVYRLISYVFKRLQKKL